MLFRGRVALCLGVGGLLSICVLAWCFFGSLRDEAARQPSAATRPNIVIVLVDALRADQLGVYGSSRQLSPAIDELAREGVTFEQTISQAPWTQPSVASLFCSFYPSVHQVRDYELAWNSTFAQTPAVAVFGESFTTLAEVIHGCGYQTAAFSANPWVVPEFGFGRGFEHFDASFATFGKGSSISGRTLNQAVFRWLAERDVARPFFLYLHYMDAHGPYYGDPDCLNRLLDEVERMPAKHELTAEETERLQNLAWIPPDADAERHKRLMKYREYWMARYDAGVRAADICFNELRQGLTERGLWNNTYVIFTADHGEALCEHHFWDHGLSVYHSELHVPLILRWPGVLKGGSRIPQTVELFDLMPTLLDQLHLPAIHGLQGASLVPLLAGKPFVRRPEALAEAVKFGTEQKALYQDGLKLLFIDSNPTRAALFDIARDPDEQTDLASTAAGPYQSMLRDLVAAFAKSQSLAGSMPALKVPISEEQRRRLESLGYVGSPSSRKPTRSAAPSSPR